MMSHSDPEKITKTSKKFLVTRVMTHNTSYNRSLLTELLTRKGQETSDDLKGSYCCSSSSFPVFVLASMTISHIGSLVESCPTFFKTDFP